MANIKRVLQSSTTNYVIYESGTEREFFFDKTPKTVQAWIEANGTEKAVWQDWIVSYMPDTDEPDVSEDCVVEARTESEAIKIAKAFEAKGMIILEAQPLDVDPVEEMENIIEEIEEIIQKAEEPEASAEEPAEQVIIEETSLVPVEETEEPAPTEPNFILKDKAEEEPEAPTVHTISILPTGNEARELLEDAKAVGKLVLGFAKDATPTVIKGAAKAAEMALDGWYWLTTYLPIALRWVMVHLLWLIQDALPAVRAVMATAWGLGLGALRVSAQSITTALLMGAGATVKAGKAMGKASKAVARELANGWRLREELNAEWAA